MTEKEDKINSLCVNAKLAAKTLALLTESEKNNALNLMKTALASAKEAVIEANKQEVAQAHQKGLSEAFIDRMSLTESRFQAMLDGIDTIISLPDPVRKILASWIVPSELQISRISTPLGVIGVIYESRPNVTADAAALCFKAGNAIILRGGSECELTNRAIVKALQEGLKQSGLNEQMIQYVPYQDHESVNTLITMNDYIDVIIPRGGKSLVERISQQSKIPVFLHLDGICHTYIHQHADLAMARDIAVNAKLRRPGICGATETLLIDQEIAASYLPPILDALIEKGCEIVGDATVQSIDQRAKLATEFDWSTEYLDTKLSVKVVADINEAIAHIEKFGSHHTDAIITQDSEAADQFLREVESANVMHNCSTQFADGGEFGMGAEIGIATGKLHARGPVGLEQLTTFKYVVQGAGQVRP